MGKAVNIAALKSACMSCPKEGLDLIRSFGGYESAVRRNNKARRDDLSAITPAMKKILGKIRALEKASGTTIIDGYISMNDLETSIDSIILWAAGM